MTLANSAVSKRIWPSISPASRFLSQSLARCAPHGGFGYAKEYHVERYYREAILGLIVPVSHELILCHIPEKALELPKSC